MIEMKSKVVVIGLDGTCMDIIKPWLKYLPNLNRIISNGASGSLKSTLPPFSPVAWMSFLTGKNPGKHSIYGFDVKEKGRNTRSVVNSGHRRTEGIWDILERHGKKSIIMNFTPTYPPFRINGVLVSGMLSPDNSVFTYPPEITHTLRKMGYRIFLKERDQHRVSDYYILLEKRCEAARYLMKNQEWDFFALVFNAIEIAHHILWGKPGELLKVYKTLDSKIGELLKSIPEGTTILFLSDHGNEGLDGIFYVNNLLMEMGLLKLKQSGYLGKILSRIGLHRDRIVGITNRLGIKEKVRKIIPRTVEEGFAYSSKPGLLHIDWRKTKAYYTTEGKIYLNVKGRDPEGIITGSEYGLIRDMIIEKLKTLKNPKTGKGIIQEIYRKEEIYSGPYLENAPDIVFWTKGYVPGLWNLKVKLFGKPETQFSKHDLHGMFCIHGPGIKKGTQKANITDLAPTILQIMGLPIPQDMDGRVLDVFKAKKKPEMESTKMELKGRIRELKTLGRI